MNWKKLNINCALETELCNTPCPQVAAAWFAASVYKEEHYLGRNQILKQILGNCFKPVLEWEVVSNPVLSFPFPQKENFTEL